ncbi:MAG: DUF58 domain-containing protein [Gemmataceae bacterium]|nr:DUF58 domain-containing protein [Gemmataceae bacterium]
MTPSSLDPHLLNEAQSLGLAARGVVEGLRVGDHRSPFRGFSVEFVQHREYVPGDDVRHIDWKSYARTGRYTVKQYQQETNFAGHLLLDASRSMAYGKGPSNKLATAKLLTATLAYVIIQQRDSAALAVFSTNWQERLPASAQPGHLQAVLETLAGTVPFGATAIGPLLNDLAAQTRRRGLVFVISDCFDDPDAILRGLQHLRFRGHEVTLFHIMHGDELTFPFTGNVRFLGMELPEELMAKPQLLKPAYLRAVEAFRYKLRQGCDACRADYVLVDTTRSLSQTLSEYLARRPLVKL